MASLLLSCAALCSARMSKRRKAKRESKKDFREHFDALQAENMRRESWRQSLNNNAVAQVQSTAPDTTLPAYAPPKYDDVATRKSMESSVDGRVDGRDFVDRAVGDRRVDGSTARS